MIWSKALPDGTRLEVAVALLPLKGYRAEREYTVFAVTPGGGKLGVCKVGEDGVPKRWFQHGDVLGREAVGKAIEDLPNSLLVEQVEAI